MEAMTSWMSSLPHSWTRDIREPIFTFQLEGDGQQEWGFYCMNPIAWIELLTFFSLQALLVACLSTIVYKFVIPQPKQQTSSTQLLLSHLICYGLIIPSLFLGPIWSFQLLNIRNQFYRFCIGAILPVTCLFKTTAALYGLTPPNASLTMSKFAFYYAVPLPMKHDAKLDKYTPTNVMDVLSHLKGFVVMLLVFGALNTLLLYFPHIMPPIAAGQLPADSDWYDLTIFFTQSPLNWLPRNLIFAIYFQVVISVMGEGLIVAQSVVTGIQVESVMDNPVLTSRSFSQFWGAKWNLVIHDVLKRGVYLPVRKYFGYSKHIAMLSTFIASGLFHEGLLYMALYPLDNRDGCWSTSTEATISKVDCYQPPLFVTTLFFIWQAMGIAIEYTMPSLTQNKMWGKVPDPIMTTIIVFCGCPLAHFFCEPYWNSLVFDNGMMLFFVAKPIL